MRPKEKAKELVDKYLKGKDENGWSLCEFNSCAKQCALISVDEILNLMIKEFKWDVNNNGNIAYWQEVKQEIEKL